VDVVALSQEKQNNLAQIQSLQDTITNLQTRNTTIDGILALAPSGVTVPSQPQG
jgi:chaperonin cofactor prefoldin